MVAFAAGSAVPEVLVQAVAAEIDGDRSEFARYTWQIAEKASHQAEGQCMTSDSEKLVVAQLILGVDIDCVGPEELARDQGAYPVVAFRQRQAV